MHAEIENSDVDITRLILIYYAVLDLACVALSFVFPACINMPSIEGFARDVGGATALPSVVMPLGKLCNII